MKYDPIKALRKINEYIDSHSDDLMPCIKTKKVFYHYTEWSGWRFWKKAILNLDFASMKSYRQRIKEIKK